MWQVVARQRRGSYFILCHSVARAQGPGCVALARDTPGKRVNRCVMEPALRALAIGYRALLLLLLLLPDNTDRRRALTLLKTALVP
jgi:hypothetical protein